MKHSVYISKMRKLRGKVFSAQAHFNKKLRFQLAKEIVSLWKHQSAALEDWRVAQNG